MNVTITNIRKLGSAYVKHVESSLRDGDDLTTVVVGRITYMLDKMAEDPTYKPKAIRRNAAANKARAAILAGLAPSAKPEPKATAPKATEPKATSTRRTRVRRQTKATMAQSGPEPKVNEDMISVRVAMTLIPAAVAETLRQLKLA